MYAVLDIVELAEEYRRPVDLAARVYFALAGKLGLRWVASQVGALPSDTHWQAMARAAMRFNASKPGPMLRSLPPKVFASITRKSVP